MFKKLAGFFHRRRTGDIAHFRALFGNFQQILAGNNRTLELISELDDKLGGEYIFDINYLKYVVENLSKEIYLIISNLNVMADNHYSGLFSRQSLIQDELKRIIEGLPFQIVDDYVLNYSHIDFDFMEIVGSKNALLGEIKNNLKMLTPDGFAVTTLAYRKFMESNNLWPEIKKIHNSFSSGDKKSIGQYDRSISALFENARVPPEVEKSINQHIADLQKNSETKIGLAVRSSAYGEDSQGQSYAGQFKSFLNCRGDEVLSAYVKVIASRFRREATIYGGEKTLAENRLPMAVGIQRMVAASSAGVAYSVSPSELRVDRLVIASTFGLGSAVVGGTVGADQFWVSRMDPSKIIERRLVIKKALLSAADAGGVASLPVSNERRNQASLTDERVICLAERTLLLERYFKRPVDVEWCFDDKGELYILQCRPLKLPPKIWPHPSNLREILANRPIIMRNKGQVAQRGIAAGKVWHVKEDDDPDTFPIGAIAVTRYTTPRLTAIIRRCAAIITDIGSSTGHMATISREFGVPLIVNTSDATSLLTDGEEVTVDAEENTVYKGIINELLEYEMESEDVFWELKEFHILRRLLRKISPLYLIDPNSSDFTARNCQTYHDIIRFCHEKAVQILININISSKRFGEVKSRKLKLPIPLGLTVIDLGGGLAPNVENDMIPYEMVQSVPMRAIINGLTAPGSWSTMPMQLGFGDLVSSLTKYSMTDRVAQYKGQNLAVISDRYTNLSLRLGYHFNVIDSYVSDNIDDNYIYFRFLGGVTEAERLHRRAIFIKEILEKFNFKVGVHGDLVVGRLKKCGAAEIVGILEEIGRLIGFSRQLDTQMISEESIRQNFDTFFKREDKSL